MINIISFHSFIYILIMVVQSNYKITFFIVLKKPNNNRYIIMIYYINIRI